MLSATFTELYLRDINKMINEVKAYKDEAHLWLVKEGISNSAGNLCLHITGNLKHFIGATLGQTGYIRNRDAEFSSKDIPAANVIYGLEEAAAIVQETFGKLSEADMQKDFPLEYEGRTLSTAHMLAHLFGHLNYHLGQVNYHRRLVQN